MELYSFVQCRCFETYGKQSQQPYAQETYCLETYTAYTFNFHIKMNLRSSLEAKHDKISLCRGLGKLCDML